MLKKKAVKHTIRRPKVEKETKHDTEVHKERYETRIFKTPEILKTEVRVTPEPEFRGFRGILPQRL